MTKGLLGLASLVIAVVIALAVWFGLLFIQRRKFIGPAARRPLRLLVLFARPLSSSLHLGKGSLENPAKTGQCGSTAASSKTWISPAVLETAFEKLDAPIHVHFLGPPTLAALQQELCHGYDALLFDSYNLEDDQLALEDTYGVLDPVASTELGHILHDGGIRLVFLCTGYSVQRAECLRSAGLVAVGGLHAVDREEVATGFVVSFFAALARGDRVWRALSRGWQAVVEQFGSYANVKCALLSAWRWPVLRMVRPNIAGQCCLEHPPRPQPAPPTVELLGREADIHAINRQLADSRLLTLVGPGGIGKTALAKAVARWHWERGLFPAGVRLIPLDVPYSGQDLAEMLLHQLVPDYRPPEGLAPPDLFRYKLYRLSTCIAQSRWLLVLDGPDFPLHPDDRRLIQGLLERCPDLCFLLTARGDAALEGGQVYPVEPLLEDSAAELFYRRARVPIAETEWETVAAICRYLEGNPLAIELAARCLGRSPSNMLDQFETVRANSDVARDQPGSGEHNFGWPAGLLLALNHSYDRLSEAGQGLFCVLALFSSGATVEAIQTVAGDGLVWQPALDELLERGLLEKKNTADGRYQMPPLIARYAGGCLHSRMAGSDLDRVALLRRYTAYYSALVQYGIQGTTHRTTGAHTISEKTRPAGRSNQTSSHQIGESVLDQERCNLLAAIKWAYQTKAWNTLWQLIQALSTNTPIGFWGACTEQVYLMGLEGARLSGELQNESQMLDRLAQTCCRQARWTQANAYYNQCLALWLELWDQYGKGLTMNNMGRIYLAQGRQGQAVEMFQQSLRIFCQLGDRHNEARILNELGEIYFYQGRWVEAGTMYRQSLRIFQDMEDRLHEGRTLNNLSCLHRGQGLWTEAMALAQQALDISRQIEDLHLEAKALDNLGHTCAEKGSWEQAHKYNERCLSVCRERLDPYMEGVVLANLAWVLAQQGDFTAAIQVCQQGLHILAELGDRHNEGYALTKLAGIHILQGHWDEAELAYQGALQIFRWIEDRRGEASVLHELGMACARQSSWEGAIALYEESQDILSQLDSPPDEGCILLDLGQAYIQQQLWDNAIAVCKQALAVWQRLGGRRYEGKALDYLGEIHIQQGLWDEATRYCDRYLDICRDLDSLENQARVLGKLGWIYARQDHYKEAIACYEQALTVYQEKRNRYEEGKIFARLGDIYYRQSLWIRAVKMYQRAQQIFATLKDRHSESETLMKLGQAYAHQYRWDEAIVLSEEGLHIFRELGNYEGEGQTLFTLGEIYSHQGQWPQSMAMYRRSEVFCREIKDRCGEGRALAGQGHIYRQQGRWSDAIACYERYLALSREFGDPCGEGDALINLGNIYRQQAHWAEATDCYEQKLALCRKLGDRPGEGQILFNLAGLCVDQGCWEDAIETFERCLRILDEVENLYDQGRVMMNLGLVYARKSQSRLAVVWWYRAMAVFQPLEAPEAEQIREWLKKEIASPNS